MQRTTAILIGIVAISAFAGCTTAGFTDDAMNDSNGSTAPNATSAEPQSSNESSSDMDNGSDTKNLSDSSDGVNETGRDSPTADMGEEVETSENTSDNATIADEAGRVWVEGRVQRVDATGSYIVELENGSNRAIRFAGIEVLPDHGDVDYDRWSRHLPENGSDCTELQQDSARQWAEEFRYDAVNLSRVNNSRYLVYGEDGDVAENLLYDGLARVVPSLESPRQSAYLRAMDRAKGEQTGLWGCASQDIIFE